MGLCWLRANYLDSFRLFDHPLSLITATSHYWTFFLVLFYSSILNLFVPWLILIIEIMSRVTCLLYVQILSCLFSQFLNIELLGFCYRLICFAKVAWSGYLVPLFDCRKLKLNQQLKQQVILLFHCQHRLWVLTL